MDDKKLAELLSTARASLQRATLADRTKAIIEWQTSEGRRWKEMEAISGIAANSWQQMWRGRQRPTAEMIEAVAQEWPQYAFWLVTGLADPDAGHIAPHGESQWPSLRTTNNPSEPSAGLTWKPLIELRRVIREMDETDDKSPARLAKIVDLLTTISQRSIVDQYVRELWASTPDSERRSSETENKHGNQKG